MIRLIAALAALGLILAGCTGGGDAEPAPGAAPPVATATPAATPPATAIPTPAPAATPAGTARSTATPSPTATATPSATPRPAPTAAPRTSGTAEAVSHSLSPEIVVVGGLAPDREAAFRTAFQQVFAFYTERFGIEAPGLQLYIGKDPEAMASVYRDLGGTDPDALSSGSTIAVTIGETNAIFIAGPVVAAGRVPARLIAAEFFLLVQGGLASPSEREPAWLIDGSAHYAAALFQAEHGLPYEAFREQAIVWAAPLRGSMRSLESRDGWRAQPNPSLYTSIIATDWLASLAGDRSYVDYWRQLGEHATWQEAFAAAFGISVDDFYEAFEEHRSALFADLREIRGILLGPDGDPIEGVGLLAWQGFGVGSGVVGTGPDGSFAIPVRDGVFTLQVYQDAGAAAPPFAGWVEDGGGLTVECARAARIAVDRGNVTGLVVRLPAGWAGQQPDLAQSQWQCGATVAATATPTPTATPRPTPTPPPIPLYPEIVFVGDVAPTTQAAYHAAMRDVVAYFADRHGVRPPGFGMYVGPDVDAVRAVYSEVTGRGPLALQSGGAVARIGSTAAIFVLGDFVNRDYAYPALLAHEYLHVLHANLSNFNGRGTPGWLIEGAAVYEADIYVDRYQAYLREAIVRGANYGAELRDLARIGRWDPYYGYPLGAIAAGLLAAHAGADWHIEYWRSLNDHLSWRSAFMSTFGMTVDDFYDAFEEHLATLLSESPASRMQGVVLGPEGEALRGVRLVMTARGGIRESWRTETRADGEFELHVLPGPIGIAIQVREAGTWRHVGWYGEGGLVTDRSEATVIEVGDSDVTGIEIRFAARRAELPEVRPPRIQGAVHGSDGEPLAGIGVVVWGGSNDASKLGRTAADGGFDITHQNGTFVLRIFRWTEGAWNLLGYYGEGGFTPREEQATSITVDGADVAGIEIRLPPPIRGTVLAADGQPPEGIALWVRDQATGSARFVAVSPDGTFDALFGDGTFTLEVYSWKEQGWRHHGYYSEGGFTPHEKHATSIEVDGANVTGIEIRLPPWIRGTVLGPDGEPVEGVVLWVRDEATGDAEFVWVSSDGTFEALYGDGTFTLEVSTREGEGWRRIGWYGGESGFTTEEAQAALIEVSGADVSGIEIRLPEAPADVRGPRVQGAVLGADGEPVEGVRVWLLGELDGDHKLGVTAADGTFNIEYRRGAYRIRLDFPRGDLWHPTGWHGEDGFTQNVDEAAWIEVEEPGIAGIEIHLPPRASGIVLGPDGEPVAGIGLWLWGGSRGSASKFGVSAANGMFDLFHRNGAFTIRVYAREGESWRHIGWYEDDGFTTIEHRATEIELDGADVTGIEIRLARDPAEMPTVE